MSMGVGHLEIDAICYEKRLEGYEEYIHVPSLTEAQVATQPGEERPATQSAWLSFQATKNIQTGFVLPIFLLSAHCFKRLHLHLQCAGSFVARRPLRKQQPLIATLAMCKCDEGICDDDVHTHTAHTGM